MSGVNMDAELVQILEGALFAAGEPLSVQRMSLLFEENERPSNEELREALKRVGERCEGRGYELVQVASGYRFQVRQHLSTWVGKLWQERPARYSRALMETLSLIAYRQPITRGEIEEIRGVAVSTNIVKTLLEREWVRVVGHRDVPGRPAMYATTRQFLDYFNLRSLDELPPLAEIRELLEPQMEEAVAAGAPDTADAPAASAEADGADEPDDAAPADESAESAALGASVAMPAEDADDESGPQSAEVVPLHSGGSQQQP